MWLVQNPNQMELPSFWDGGGGLAPRGWPALQASDPGSAWHLLSVESWVGAEGESDAGGRQGKGPPWRRLWATGRRGEDMVR